MRSGLRRILSFICLFLCLFSSLSAPPRFLSVMSFSVSYLAPFLLSVHSHSSHHFATLRSCLILIHYPAERPQGGARGKTRSERTERTREAATEGGARRP